MTYITTTLTIIITLTSSAAANSYSYTHNEEFITVVKLKQGAVQGAVVRSGVNGRLPLVEHYKGIPYAAPPVGNMRFMPPNSAPTWSGTYRADEFGPVCPQKFPDIRTMSNERREEFLKLKQFLRNQSEDCLYLNVYAPHQGRERTRKYAVMVYLHGESFEWNSGNPYDGSVLAAYGKVVVVTLNYRLGVFGFLQVGTQGFVQSNFGLVDQMAALLWVKENIAAFGGNPNLVTVFGHGTGAACASLLMLSPMIEKNGMLFQRAILMGGTALSDWALAGNPRQVSYQVAQALNCQFQEDFALCLQKKRLEDIMAASVETEPYRTRFGPVVDGRVLPNDAKNSMSKFTHIFGSFELMYGVTEIESTHLLGPAALKFGMLEKERDQELRRYLRWRCQMRPEVCLTRTLAEYAERNTALRDADYTGHEPDVASLNWDALLDILSDAKTVAPMVQMAKYHAKVNQQSYFYVFTHKTQSKEHLRDKSSNGDELPYVFGVPLGGSRFHFTDRYNEKERLLSEIIMTYFCNFAYTGDPNMPRKSEYITLGAGDWATYEKDWPEFDSQKQQYLQLGLPSYVSSYYREDKVRYWNEIFPKLSHNSTEAAPPFLFYPPRRTQSTYNKPNHYKPYGTITSTVEQPGGYLYNKYDNFQKPLNKGTSPSEHTMNNIVYGTVRNAPKNESTGISTTVTIALCSVFLLSNLCLFIVLYIRHYRKKKMRKSAQKGNEVTPEDEDNETRLIDVCNIMKIVGKSSRSDDTYEAVKSTSSTRRLKLPRQMSTSTIDAHTKVRDWITNEVVYKYSPRFFRRPKHTHDVKFPEPKEETLTNNENNSTLGRSPTRPVTPSDNYKPQRPPLIKSSSIPVHKQKKIEKVSVAIDATPSGRGPSVLAQQPIELTKSLDRPNFEAPLRRSLTMEDFSIIKPTDTSKQELRKSTTSINLKFPPPDASTVIRIEHAHSKSDPVQDFYGYTNAKKLKTFDPNSDVNVTSRDEQVQKVPLTPEESLMTIKRRNFPKVLPDYPSRDALAKKRRSMPVANHLFTPIPEVPAQPQPHSPINKNFAKLPPAPPLRTTSTLSRKPSGKPQPVCQSAPMLAQEPPESPEPEVTFNNLYFGPLIPKMAKTELSSSESSKLNTQPIYDSLRMTNENEKKVVKPVAKTVVTADSSQPIKRVEPRVVIKPTMTRNLSDSKKNIPRVMVRDNLPEDDKGKKLLKPSQIPTVAKGSKESSSSESTPSEESDTGTVVKKM